MHFPRFWAKAAAPASQSGLPHAVACWRWSDTSLADAQRLAREAVQQLATRLAGNPQARADRYAYGNRPLREPVLTEFKAPDGTALGVITRNAYGALVLNTARAMFVDIDVAKDLDAKGGMLSGLFGGGARKRAAEIQEQICGRLEDWAGRHAGWCWRVYRTRAGFRALATHAPVPPEPGVMEPVFEALLADPLYRKLCAVQKCYRARLTPKPWRCGLPQPAGRWPFENQAAEARFALWNERYLAKSAGFATCRLVSTIGPEAVHPEIQSLVEAHDTATNAIADLPLA